MLPGRERLREIATGTEGSVAEVPYAVLLSALAFEKRSCLAVLHHHRTEKRIIFVGGAPVDCRSNLVNETFGRFLVQQGKLTEDAFSLCFAQSSARALKLGQVLVEQELFTEDEVHRLLQQNLARKLLDGFTWREGSYRLFPDPPVPDLALKVNVPQLVVTGVARFAAQAEVDRAVGSLVGQRIALAPGAPFPIEEIRLTDAQGRLAEALRKRPRIDELAVEVKLPFEEITRLLYALWLLGNVVPADQVPAAPRPAPAAETRHRPEAAPSPPDLATLRRREELLAFYEGFRERDAFDLLALPEDASSTAVRVRYLERAAAWAPWAFDGSEAEKAEALFLAAARAYAVLADDESRAALRTHRRSLITPGRSLHPEYAIKTDLLDPESQYKKGIEFLEADQPGRAVTFLEFAADCDPQNGTYAATAAWARFLASGRTNPASTLKDLDEAARIDKKCGVAHFYAGEIHRSRKELDRAEDAYRRAGRLMPGDRRPLDGLREMARAAR